MKELDGRWTMTDKQKEEYEEIVDEYINWWGWEEGYTYEDASNFFMRMADSFQTLLQEIEVNGNDKK